MKRSFQIRSRKFRYALVLFSFFVVSIYIFFQIQQEKRNFKHKLIRRTNSQKPISSKTVLNTENLPERSIDQFKLSGNIYLDTFKNLVSTNEASLKSKFLKSDDDIFYDEHNVKKKGKDLTRFLKPEIQAHQHFLLNISNAAGDKLPLQYQNTFEHPIPYSECGMNEKMKPWSYLSKDIDMLFLIKTSLHHIKPRNFIRTTWGSVSSVRNMRFASIFVVGLPGTTNLNASDNENELLLAENQIFGDLLQCEFEDSYKNLPIKVLSSFRWVLMNEISSVYYTVTDDDCLMDLVNINAFFREPRQEDVVYCGFLYDERARPHRNNYKSKIFTSYDTYSSMYFPPFCHGGMYTMRLEMIRELYHMAELTNRNGLHLEDVFITGILREKLGFGSKNIEPVLTKANKAMALMYYPYTENEKTTLTKLSLKWKRFNASLPWSTMEESESLMTVFKQNVDVKKVKSIISEWKSLMQLRKKS